MQDTQVYQPSEKSIFLDLLDTDAFLDRYEHSLRGEVLVTIKEKDEKGRQTVKQEWQSKYSKKMNDDGIMATMGFLRTICDKTISMTDYSEEMIDVLIKQNANAWLDFLCVNYAQFGLSTPSRVREVYYPARNLIIAKFRSAVDGMTVNAISKTTNVSEVKQLNQEPLNDGSSPNFLNKLGIKV